MLLYKKHAFLNRKTNYLGKFTQSKESKNFKCLNVIALIFYKILLFNVYNFKR